MLGTDFPYTDWYPKGKGGDPIDHRSAPLRLADPDYDARGVVQKVRARFDNPDERIRPEAVAVAGDRHAR